MDYIKKKDKTELKRNIKADFLNSIENDNWMIEILKIIRDLNLNDCWIGAGFVRNKIWDEEHKITRTKLNDIDVIYFDSVHNIKEFDIAIENKLKKNYPKLNWSVKNQARMHVRNNHQEYANCKEAISFWPETATAIAVRLNKNNKIEYIAPYGLNDLFNLIVKPTPKFNLTTYKNRLAKKQWKEKWSKLIIEGFELH